MPWIAALVLLAACGEAPQTPPPAPTATPSTAELWTNVSILPGDGTADYDGLRHDGGVITHLWRGDVPADLDGAQVDLGGATAVPGLVDAHLHLRGVGRADRQLKLVGTGSVEEVAERVRSATGRAPGTWIRGRGWDQNDWAVQDFPVAVALDAVAPNHPVWLTRVDGHAVWVNTAAMKLAGITMETRDPEGGRILRTPFGTPSGVFVDNAIDLLADALPEPTDAEIRADLLRGIELCRQAGLTGVHDLGTSDRVLKQMSALEAEGLGFRIWAFLSGGDDLAARIESSVDREGLLQVAGVKLFADGALGSRGAALLAPYSDEPGHTGLLLTSPEELVSKVQRVDAAGLQAAIHAIGDRGIRSALDAIEAVGETDRTHRIEHAQVVAAEDFARFASLGVTASMQPTHATSDMPWAEARVGADRIQGAYAWRQMLDGGIPLALGSDAPVESHDPRWGLYSAVTRQDHAGQPEGGWRAHERVTITEALSGFSAGAWRAVQQDGGVLRVGAPLDATVFGRDPRTVAPKELLTLPVVRTVVAGESVYVPE